ncbi:MAG: DUF5106 domain-containing protein [Bacteroidales bacterium]|nr:DUF5106 domain-containing protein [Bacteroidales bacterium]
MTKCHLLLLTAFLALLTACKPDKGPSLSEYGSQSQATLRAQFEQYVRELLAAPAERALQMQDSVLNAAERDSAEWRRVMDLEESFLLDPNSPYRNEELYRPVVDHLLSSPWATEKQQLRAAWIQPLLQLNRPGEPAGDFEFLTPTGRRASLYATIDARKPKRTILFFSNPGCPNCKEITETLSNSPRIQLMLDESDLLVVNIYPDEDVQEWLDYLPNYPKEWICGYDPDHVLKSDTLYWLRAIPSLYLLDEQKRVLLKDATVQEVLFYCIQG